MNNNSYRMVYDSGSKLLKCAIADELGNVIAINSYEPEVLSSENGLQREWNYGNYWDKLVELTKTTIKLAKINPKEIEYISASSIRPSCVFADEDNNAVYIGASFELLGFDYAEEIEDEFYEATGKTFYESTGHFPSFLFIPARYRYFQEEKDSDNRIEQITQYLPLESWILVKFGGELHTNFSSAAESGFLDLTTKFWHPAWEDILDLPEFFLPWPVFSGEIIGMVDEKSQKEIGLSPDTKLVSGFPDTHAALLGCQNIEPTNITAVLGTTTPVQTIIEQLIIPEEEQIWAGLFMIKNLSNNYYLETNTGMTGQILKWAANLFYADENNTLTENFKLLDQAYKEYDEFEAHATLSEIDNSRVYSLLGPAPLSNTQLKMAPGIFTFQSPGGVEEIKTHKNSFITAVFDNIQFAVTKNIEIAKQIADLKNPQISIVGGAARNPVLVQRFSDLLNIPINTSKNFESTIQGMLTLCDIAAGGIESLEDLQKRNQDLNSVKNFTPRESMLKKLEKRYQNWLELFNRYY
ncbi:MAG: putative Xylulokinase [Promethearchaeota archaeon]|nr:MAG: putative Xylulokinase [Candidatus Lokiarchaeota archaeon]